MEKQLNGQIFTYQAERRSYLSIVAVWLVLLGIEGSIVVALIALLVHMLWLKYLLLGVFALFLCLLIFKFLLSALWTSHRLTDTHLILHYGMDTIEVPISAIKSARPVQERLQAFQPLRGTLDARQQRLTMAFSEHGQVLLLLDQQYSFRMNGTQGMVERILLNVDQRDLLLAALKASVLAPAKSAQSSDALFSSQQEYTTILPIVPAQDAKVAIGTQNLSRTFDGKVVVHEINLAVRVGEIYGFLGANGSGKTTTMRMLVGLLEPTQGRAWIAGCDIWTEPVQAKQAYGYVPDKAILYERLTGREFLAFLAQMRSLPRQIAEQRIADLLALLDLTDVADTVCSTYSFGMKRKLAVAGALIHQPSVLILDEPFNGLDPRSMRRLKTLFAELTTDGVTIFLSTHDLALAESICHRIGILHRGRLVAEGSVQELRQLATASNLEEVFFSITEDQEEVLA